MGQSNKTIVLKYKKWDKKLSSYLKTQSKGNKRQKTQWGTGGDEAALDSFQYILINLLHTFHTKWPPLLCKWSPSTDFHNVVWDTNQTPGVSGVRATHSAPVMMVWIILKYGPSRYYHEPEIGVYCNCKHFLIRVEKNKWQARGDNFSRQYAKTDMPELPFNHGSSNAASSALWILVAQLSWKSNWAAILDPGEEVKIKTIVISQRELYVHNQSVVVLLGTWLWNSSGNHRRICRFRVYT